MSPTRPPLSAVLPPLVLGSATFNHQYNADPFSLPTTRIVHSALQSGIRAFDTSPYYGPAEQLLGKALQDAAVRAEFPRESYVICTKVGRIAADTFDYSPGWVRESIARSLDRLGTDYLDCVYCHDVEFVSAEEVLTAVRTLRELRAEGKVRYVGISGYPVGLLAELAATVKRKTGEPLDLVMSYANFTVQNDVLRTYLDAFHAAGVGVLLNGSPLGMGLLRKEGVPVGSMGDFHPASRGLRQACADASELVESRGRTLAEVSIRWAYEAWARTGARLGTTVRAAVRRDGKTVVESAADKLGVTVCGVSTLAELESTVRVWEDILRSVGGEAESVGRWEGVSVLVEEVRGVMGSRVGETWASPGEDFVRKRRE